MRIEIQKILRWIPIVNFIIIFFTIYFYRKNNISSLRFMKSCLKIMGIVFITSIPRIISFYLRLPLFIQQIFGVGQLLIVLFSWATIGIRDQEEFMRKGN